MVNRRNFFNLGDTSSIPAAFSDVTNPISQYDFGEYEDMVMAEDGTLVPRSFYDVMDLGEFENPIETAAFQIQMAGSMNPEALAATEGMLTPYGPGLTVDEIEGIAEEYIGITSGINLNDELELLGDADALYDNPVFGKAYSTVVERAKGAGLDMNNLQTAINVLQNAGQAIGYKTVPSDTFDVPGLPVETDLFRNISLAPDIGIDDVAFADFIGTIADESADKYKKQSLLNNYVEAARIQINTPSGVLPETAANISELERDLQNINTSEMLEELYATEGQQAVQQFISNPDSYTSGQLSLEGTRGWIDGVTGDSEGVLQSAFEVADSSFTGLERSNLGTSTGQLVSGELDTGDDVFLDQYERITDADQRYRDQQELAEREERRARRGEYIWFGDEPTLGDPATTQGMNPMQQQFRGGSFGDLGLGGTRAEQGIIPSRLVNILNAENAPQPGQPGYEPPAEIGGERLTETQRQALKNTHNRVFAENRLSRLGEDQSEVAEMVRARERAAGIGSRTGRGIDGTGVPSWTQELRDDYDPLHPMMQQLQARATGIGSLGGAAGEAALPLTEQQLLESLGAGQLGAAGDIARAAQASDEFIENWGYGDTFSRDNLDLTGSEAANINIVIDPVTGEPRQQTIADATGQTAGQTGQITGQTGTGTGQMGTGQMGTGTTAGTGASMGAFGDYTPDFDPSLLTYFTPEQQFQQYLRRTTAPGNPLRGALSAIQSPLMQQYYLTAGGMDTRYGGAGDPRSFEEVLQGQRLTPQDLQSLAQEAAMYGGMSGEEIMAATLGQGVDQGELNRRLALQRIYGESPEQRRALAQTLATQRAGGGFYGGVFGDAIRRGIADLQTVYQSQNPLGGDAGNFLNYYLQQTGAGTMAPPVVNNMTGQVAPTAPMTPVAPTPQMPNVPLGSAAGAASGLMTDDSTRNEILKQMEKANEAARAAAQTTTQQASTAPAQTTASVAPATTTTATTDAATTAAAQQAAAAAAAQQAAADQAAQQAAAQQQAQQQAAAAAAAAAANPIVAPATKPAEQIAAEIAQYNTNLANIPTIANNYADWSAAKQMQYDDDTWDEGQMMPRGLPVAVQPATRYSNAPLPQSIGERMATEQQLLEMFGGGQLGTGNAVRNAARAAATTTPFAGFTAPVKTNGSKTTKKKKKKFEGVDYYSN